MSIWALHEAKKYTDKNINDLVKGSLFSDELPIVDGVGLLPDDTAINGRVDVKIFGDKPPITKAMVSVKDRYGNIIGQAETPDGIELSFISNTSYDSFDFATGIETRNCNVTVINGDVGIDSQIKTMNSVYRCRVLGWPLANNALQTTPNSAIANNSQGDFLQRIDAADNDISFPGLFDNSFAFTLDNLYIWVNKVEVDAMSGSTIRNKFINYLNQYPLTISYQNAEPVVVQHTKKILCGVPKGIIQTSTITDTLPKGCYQYQINAKNKIPRLNVSTILNPNGIAANGIIAPCFITAKQVNKIMPDRIINAPYDSTATYLGGARTPIITGYLYNGGVDGKELYYSDGKLDNLIKIAEWGLMPNHPDDYNAIISDVGDIIFIKHGLAGKGNPIVFPAGDYANPVELDMVGNQPISGTRNQSLDYCTDKGIFMFVERFEGGGDTHVWKVVKPFTNTANWTKVLTVRQGTDILHWHSVQYDPFGDCWVATSGDFGNQVRVYVSSNDGVTWDMQVQGNQKWRLLNCIFTEDYIYWVPDSGGGTGDGDEAHSLYRCARDVVSKIPDFTTTEFLALFPYGQPSYGNVYIKELNGILSLAHIDLDYVTEKNTVSIPFWSIDDNKLYILGEFPRLIPDQGAFGFRTRGVALYPNPQENRIVLGFNPYYANGIKIGDNDLIDCQNIVLEVVRE